MAMTIRGLLICCGACALLVLEPRSSLLAQEAQPVAPEVVPVPAAAEPAAQPQYPHGYGPVEAGQESYQRAEAQRGAAVQAQVELNGQMRQQAAVPGVAAYAWAPGVVWGPRRAYRYGPWAYPGYVPYPPAALRPYRSVFEPWPMVPGRIYGYPYLNWVPQSRGQVQIQIGPGVILSRPDYGPPPQAPQGPTLAPPAAPEAVPAPAPAPADPALPELNPPAPPAPAPSAPPQPGAREF